MRRLAILIPLLLVLAACGGSETDESTTTTTAVDGSSTSTTSVTTSTTTTTTIPAQLDAVWPLTGIPTDEDVTAPIIAAKIDNTASGRPQEGLESADLVFEVLVEGGIPRLVALFHSAVPETIGPMRSLREVDPKLVAPFGVLFANSGGDAPIRALLSGIATDVGDPALGSIAYFRASDRSAPYNLMLDTAGLAGQAAPSAPSGDWIDFADDTAAGEQALSVEVAMSAGHTANYRWSSGDRAYLRFNGERAHEAASGDQITAQNVIVVFARQFDTGRRDRAGSVVPDYEVTGSGVAIVFRDGVAIEGSWERGSVDSFFRLFDSDGQPIALSPGSTWVQVVPTGRSVSWS